MSFAAAFSSEAPVFTCDGAVWRAGEAPGRDGRGPGAVLRRGAAAPRRLVIACGCCTDAELLALTSPGAAEAALERVREYYGALCRRFEFRTGDAALDAYLNGWAVYRPWPAG